MNTAMTPERKAETITFIERLCTLAETPEKSIADLNEYEAEHGTEDTRHLYDLVRKMIHILSGPTE